MESDLKSAFAQHHELHPQYDDIQRLSTVLFSSLIRVWVVEYRCEKDVSQACWTRAVDLQKHLATLASLPSKKRIRVSLFKPTSLAPVQIDPISFSCLVNKFHLCTAFLDLVIGFRGCADLFSERAHGLWMAQLNAENSSLSLCYSLGFVEPRDSAGSEIWAERQIGVYDRFYWAGKTQSITVLLFTGAASKAQRNFTSGQNRDEWHNPLQLHLAIFTAYVGNWRWYLDMKRAKCVRWENEVLTASLDDYTDSSLTFERLQDVRNEQTYLLSATTTLNATINTLTKLLEIADSLSGMQQKRQDFQTKANNHTTHEEQLFHFDVNNEKKAILEMVYATQGYLESLRLIQGRFEQLTRLLADGINHRGQLNAAKINSSLLDLQKRANDENFSVRTITLITLIYLPTQFVAGIFGTNFIIYKEQQRAIEISRDFWIFIAIAVPLTLLTIALWLSTLWHRRRVRARVRSDVEKASVEKTR